MMDYMCAIDIKRKWKTKDENVCRYLYVSSDLG